MPPVLGLIVNPIAGMGGSVALLGTDGDRARRAVELGAVPVAAVRAGRALRRLAQVLPRLRVLAAAGDMGADLCRSQGRTTPGWSTVDVPVATTSTSAADTRDAARSMAEQGVNLLLFAGGDGTARDVLAGTGREVPILGVPTGVKMHSGAFATTPEAAADVAARYLSSTGDLSGASDVRLRQVEVLDTEVLDAETSDRESGHPFGTELFGVARVPQLAGRVQQAKSGRPRQDEAALDALCQQIAAELAPGLPDGRIHLIGPGTTTARILTALGLAGSLRGVDAVRDGQLVGVDLSERAMLALLANGVAGTLVLGVIGGQGFLLGRGNQQISSAVVQSVGQHNVMVVASAGKLLELDPPVLHVDLGQDGPDSALAGHRQVRTGPGRAMVMKVVC